MNSKIALASIVVGFLVFCGWLVCDCGLISLQQAAANEKLQDADVPGSRNVQSGSGEVVILHADNASAETVTVGSLDPNSGFEFELELSSRGAAIRRATFTRFDDRDYKNPQPLVILSSIDETILPLANKDLVVFLDSQAYKPLPMDRLHWQSQAVEKSSDGSQTARFEAIIKVKGTGEPALRLVKSYRVFAGSYQLDCALTVENLLTRELTVRFNLAGPLERHSDIVPQQEGGFEECYPQVR